MNDPFEGPDEFKPVPGACGDKERRAPGSPCSYELIAVVSGSGRPRAMMRDQDGIGRVLRVGDRLADSPFEVVEIDSQEVVFQSADGVRTYRTLGTR